MEGSSLEATRARRSLRERPPNVYHISMSEYGRGGGKGQGPSNFHRGGYQQESLGESSHQGMPPPKFQGNRGRQIGSQAATPDYDRGKRQNLQQSPNAQWTNNMSEDWTSWGGRQDFQQPYGKGAGPPYYGPPPPPPISIVAKAECTSDPREGEQPSTSTLQN